MARRTSSARCGGRWPPPATRTSRSSSAWKSSSRRTSPPTDGSERHTVSDLSLDLHDAGLTTPELVILEMEATSKEDASAQLASRMYEAGRISDLEAFLDQVNSREHQMATGLPGGVGLPHARSQYVNQTSIAVGVTRFGHSLDFGAVDGPATLVLLMATPAQSFSEHLEVLATIARSLFKENFRESLRRAHDAEVIAELINSSLVFFDH
ncbi:PTS sugar transporter subunit IIA [Arthrobacter sp. NamB2]|nr:PTS sugar transporter subunit IIA [Arthrobacter sp. NamB2]